MQYNISRTNSKTRDIKVLVRSAIILSVLFIHQAMSFSQHAEKGIKGDSVAIAELRAMVNTMGGIKIWSQLKSVHFVHRWYFWNKDSYVENEILDLTGPRSWVEMKNETYHRIRAYSPEHKYWNIINGEFSYASDEALSAALERAPYSIYRVARAVAINDSTYEVRLGKDEFPGSPRLDLYGPDRELHGYIVLNANKEPLVWATSQYKYTFGPMKKFGNLAVPNWAVTADGAVTYEMISLEGDNKRPDPELFIPRNQSPGDE